MDVKHYTSEFIVLVVSSIILGVVIEIFFTKLSILWDPKRHSKPKILIILLLQLITNGIVIYNMVRFNLTNMILTDLIGIIFPSLLFGIQTNIYNSIQLLMNGHLRYSYVSDLI